MSLWQSRGSHILPHVDSSILDLGTTFCQEIFFFDENRLSAMVWLMLII